MSQTEAACFVVCHHLLTASLLDDLSPMAHGDRVSGNESPKI